MHCLQFQDTKDFFTLKMDAVWGFIPFALLLDRRREKHFSENLSKVYKYWSRTRSGKTRTNRILCCGAWLHVR